MIRPTPSRALTLLFIGATISSGVLAAPTPLPMSSSLLPTEARGLHARSSPPEKGLLSDLQRHAVELPNLVRRTNAEVTERDKAQAEIKERLSSMIGTSQFTLQEMQRQGLTDQQINNAFNDMIRQQTNELDSIERAPNIAHQVELRKIHAVAKSIHDFIDANSELYTAGLHFKTSWNAARANELLKALTPVGAVASRGSSLS
ncbi:hypothetical protein FB446DRAFT_702345 [Lentinula raphanica]|nr:hypothetical protein FB446DRAFT_702345 [Lentinula raphanica]